MAASNVLKVCNSIELASYILNQMNTMPGVGDLPLPTASTTLKDIGKLILENGQVTRNAFYNVVNRIATVVMTRSYYEFPYGWMLKGTLAYGESIEEIDADIVNPYSLDYAIDNPQLVLDNFVPDVRSTIYPLNMAMVYPVTLDYNEAAKAFLSENGLFDLIDYIAGKQYESSRIDLFFLVKYMVQRRIITGTITPVYISGYDDMDARTQVAEIKGIVNQIVTAPSRNYNPAGLMKGVNFDDMTLIIDGHMEAQFTTNVLSTSFFRDDAQFQISFAMIDDWSTNDFDRLTKLIPDVQPFTADELTILKGVRAFCSTRDWWRIYDRSIQLTNASGSDIGTNMTEFYNAWTNRVNRFLHVQRWLYTSPYQPAFFVTTVQPSITSVTATPKTMELNQTNASMTVQLGATVVSTGGVNQSVYWEIDANAVQAGVTIDITGKVTIPANYEGTITATVTSVFDNTKTDTATITVAVAG